MFYHYKNETPVNLDQVYEICKNVDKDSPKILFMIADTTGDERTWWNFETEEERDLVLNWFKKNISIEIKLDLEVCV